MKSILFFSIIFSLAFFNISCNRNNENPISTQHNFVVVLDLSDRLLNANQKEKDSCMIMATFKEFEDSARKTLILTSTDRFSVRIIPQKNSPLQQDYFENKLSLDLSKIDAAHKNSDFEKLKKELPNLIATLYHQANLGVKSDNYFGVDIWKFFNNEMNDELMADAINKVIVITDGYFDFNDNTHVLQQKNKYTSTQFLNALTMNDWQTKASIDDVGLVPVNISKKTKWVIVGLQSKNQNDIEMEQKLEYFWQKWLIESNQSKPKFILNNACKVMIEQYFSRY
ncbi:MAG: hypothetical protein RL708_345 [Bacteroidota bacterium]|jgi:hypothetical protein